MIHLTQEIKLNPVIQVSNKVYADKIVEKIDILLTGVVKINIPTSKECSLRRNNNVDDKYVYEKVISR